MMFSEKFSVRALAAFLLWQRRNILILAAFLLFAPMFGASRLVVAQQPAKIDHLTVAEDDLIHDAQELDKRIAIYVKAIDRRFTALGGKTETQDGSKKKDADKWGALPTGTPQELLADVKSILEEAVRNIDNAAERDAKNALLPKALKILGDGCSRFVAQLKPFYESAQTEATRAAAYDATENCREVIQANSKQIAP